jgi:hypothetical protein
LTTAKTQLFSLDELTAKKTSVAAEVTGNAVDETNYDWITGKTKSELTALLVVDAFSVDIDNSGVPVKVDLSKFTSLSSTTKITGDMIAEEATNQLIKGFGIPRTSTDTAGIVTKGDERYGMKVLFDAVNKKFVVQSGTTGDSSSIKVSSVKTGVSS